MASMDAEDTLVECSAPLEEMPSLPANRPSCRPRSRHLENSLCRGPKGGATPPILSIWAEERRATPWVSGHGLVLLGFSLFLPDLGGGGSVLLGFFSRGSSVEGGGAGLAALAAATSSGLPDPNSAGISPVYTPSWASKNSIWSTRSFAERTMLLDHRGWRAWISISKLS